MRPLSDRSPSATGFGPDTLSGCRPDTVSAVSRDVCGVVLAGSYYWGQSTFEQLLRGPLLPLAQLPIVCYPLAWLRDGGVPSAIVCANSSTPMVQRTLGDGATFGMSLRYYADEQPRGPAGCARDAALQHDTDTVVIVEGAMIPSLDLERLLDAHRRSGAAVTTVVEVDRRRNQIGRQRPHAPGGIYVVERRILDEVPAHGFQDIKQGLLERLYDAGERVHTHEVQGMSPRVLDYEGYLSVSGWLVATAASRHAFRDYLPIGEGLRHPSAVVDPTAQILGPVLLGPGVRVEAGAVLVGPVSIGAHTQVGAGAVVARSSLWERCHVGDGAMVDSTLLAHGVAVAPRAQLLGAVEVVDGAGRAADVLAIPVLPWEPGTPVAAPADFSLVTPAIAAAAPVSVPAVRSGAP